MNESRDEELLERAAAALRTSSPRDDASLAELLAVLRAGGPGIHSLATADLPSPASRRARRWLAVALAAGIAFAAGVGVTMRAGWGGGGRSPSGRAGTAEFLLVAPRATRVALVGGFNGWDPVATPMRRAGDGAWRVEVPLTAGRHVYAFVVDGSDWVPDPGAPLAPERWFGAQNSVRLIAAAGGTLP